MKPGHFTATYILLILAMIMLIAQTNAQSLFQSHAGKDKAHSRDHQFTGLKYNHGAVYKSVLKHKNQVATNFPDLFMDKRCQPDFNFWNDYCNSLDQQPGYTIIDVPVKLNSFNGWYVAGGSKKGILFSGMCLYDNSNELNIKKKANVNEHGVFGGAGYQFSNGLAVNFNTGLSLQPFNNQVIYIGYSDRNGHFRNLNLSTGFYYMNNQYNGTGINERKNDFNEIAGVITEVLISLYKSQLK